MWMLGSAYESLAPSLASAHAFVPSSGDLPDRVGSILFGLFNTEKKIALAVTEASHMLIVFLLLQNS